MLKDKVLIAACPEGFEKMVKAARGGNPDYSR